MNTSRQRHTYEGIRGLVVEEREMNDEPDPDAVFAQAALLLAVL